MRQLIYLMLCSLLSFPLSAQVFDMDTIQYNGDLDNYINIVFLGDGYTEDELSTFSSDAQKATLGLFNESPFLHYKNYFNVFSIKVPSNESGAALNPEEPIDNYFGSTYGYAGIDRLLVPTNYTNINAVLANNFPAYDQVFMIVNSSKYGGSGGWIATFSTHSSADELAFHELGHSFANLADEYWAGSQYAAEAINMTQETNLELIKWKNWYGDYEIGLYPYSESPSWYRPHQNCKMRYLGSPFCKVCSEGIIERIHTLVSPITAYEPKANYIEVADLPLLFRCEFTDPLPNTLKKVWRINNIPLEHNKDSVLVDFDDLKSGLNVLSLTVEDTTQLLRIDNHSSKHISVVNWTINNLSTGIENIFATQQKIKIEIYPNPFQQIITIDFRPEAEADLRLEIYDMLGKRIKSESLISEQSNPINLEALEPGTYIARFYMNNNFLSSEKIMKTQ